MRTPPPMMSKSQSMQTKFLVGILFHISLCLYSLFDTRLNPLFFFSCKDLIRSISDPAPLDVVGAIGRRFCTSNHSGSKYILIEFTPTVPHCGMSTLIGLFICVRLLRALPTRFKVDICVKPGSHQSEHTSQCSFVTSMCLQQ